MEGGARGCEVVVAGKVRGQRAKAMKFVDGVMIHAGNAAREHVEESVCHVFMRQGILGCRVTINKSQDTGEAPTNPSTMLPDHVYIHKPKEEDILLHELPYSTDALGNLITDKKMEKNVEQKPANESQTHPQYAH